mmetsp:Transcript_30452/g.70211  ORF Transcript_30452/g.70211 Transcript_30452/m.70211 type:complete len:208 (+) Transcript_30452:785-1408(+)
MTGRECSRWVWEGEWSMWVVDQPGRGWDWTTRLRVSVADIALRVLRADDGGGADGLSALWASITAMCVTTPLSSSFTPARMWSWASRADSRSLPCAAATDGTESSDCTVACAFAARSILTSAGADSDNFDTSERTSSSSRGRSASTARACAWYFTSPLDLRAAASASAANALLRAICSSRLSLASSADASSSLRAVEGFAGATPLGG